MIRCPQQHSVWDRPRGHHRLEVFGCDGPGSCFPPGKAPIGWVPIFDVHAQTEIVHHVASSPEARVVYENARTIR